MTDLTEQWKKGELPEGRYWVKIKTWCEYITMLYYTSDIFLDCDVPVDNDKIIEVLAPVPSYEEYKDLKSKLQIKETAYDFDTARLEEENAQLKERVSKLEKMQYSYTPEEWNTMLRTVNRTSEQNAQLKEVLKECELWFTGMVGNMNDKNVGEHNKSVPIGNFEYIFKEFSQKIKEVLK